MRRHKESDTPKQDTAPGNEPPEALSLMTEYKEKQLEIARRGNPVSSLLKTAAGALTGTVVGAATVSTVIFKRLYQGIYALARQNPQLRHDPQAGQKLGAKVGIQLAREQSLAGNMLRHPGKWTAGAALVGGVIGYEISRGQQQEKAQDLREDVDTLKHIDASWQERMAAKNTLTCVHST